MNPPELAHHRSPLGEIKTLRRQANHLAEYNPRDIHEPIFVADYELTLKLPMELATSLPGIGNLETESMESMKEGDQ
jgi:hypothetical protein